MNQVKKGDIVKVNYKAKTQDEVIFDSTTIEPLKITIGKEEVIPAFEDALLKMNIGESKTIHVSADKAFGPYLEELISQIERDKIPPEVELQIGQQLQIQQPDGSAIIVKVLSLDDKVATFDANHPLAGKDITFDIDLLEIN
jgi:FKBP-type peptidyl-prolyl cis-trans isomerase 2